MEKISLLQFPVVSGLEMKILQSIDKDLSPCHTYTEVNWLWHLMFVCMTLIACQMKATALLNGKPACWLEQV